MAATQGSCTNNKYSLWLCPSAGSVGHARLTAEMASLAQLGNASFPPHISVATNLEGTEAEIVEKTRIVVKAIKVSPADSRIVSLSLWETNCSLWQTWNVTVYPYSNKERVVVVAG